MTSISELDLNHFFHHFSKPAKFIFSVSGKSRRPPASAWSAQLITFAQICRLYDRRPWEIYERRIDLISFQRGGWFQILLAQYYDFEDRHRQALWEASHFLPISIPSVDQIRIWRLSLKSGTSDDLVLGPSGSEFCVQSFRV